MTNLNVPWWRVGSVSKTVPPLSGTVRPLRLFYFWTPHDKVDARSEHITFRAGMHPQIPFVTNTDLGPNGFDEHRDLGADSIDAVAPVPKYGRKIGTAVRTNLP